MANSPKSTTQSVQPGLDLDDGRVVMGKKLEADVGETPSSVHPSHDTSITKVNARYSPRGRSGQKYLASASAYRGRSRSPAKATAQRQTHPVQKRLRGRS